MTMRILSAALFLTLFSVGALAHPLGNFSVNQYSHIEPLGSQIKVRQILDLAEIPTFQELAKIDADKNGEYSVEELNAYAAAFSPGYLANLNLTVDGNEVLLTSGAPEIGLIPGNGDLKTLRMVWELSGSLSDKPENGLTAFQNLNYAERVGWNEIVVGRTAGINIFNSTAFGSGVSDELRSYPQESIAVPLAERSATFSFTAGAAPADSKLLVNRDGHRSTAVQTDRLAALIAVPEITPMIAVFGLLLAFGLGAIHAMSPGHGKTVVGAYLVGSRGTARHALFLGLTVTITHTLGVFALGLITLFASNYIMPEKMMPFLSFVSGLLVFYIGITLFKNRLFGALGWAKSGDHHHHLDHEHYSGEEHSHSHDAHDALTHTHDGHTHSHLPPEEIGWKSLLGLGISGGLLPCPSALVLMLSAIYASRVGYGLILTIAFSLGLAATLTAVGLAFLYVGKALGGTSLGKSRVIKTLPAFSALLIACIGAVMCYSALG